MPFAVFAVEKFRNGERKTQISQAWKLFSFKRNQKYVLPPRLHFIHLIFNDIFNDINNF